MLKGSFELIGDKSISHRAVMFSSISKGHNKISNFLMGEDCLSTISCFRKMGVDIQIDGKDVYVKGNGLYGLKRPKEILDVGNSGTTIRLMMGILAGNKFDATLIGDNSIAKRPMKRVTDPLRLMGCNIEGKDDAKAAASAAATEKQSSADTSILDRDKDGIPDMIDRDAGEGWANGEADKPEASTSDVIANPSLWTPETPSLYQVKTMLVDAKTGKTLDERIHKTGFRWFAFDGNKGFTLNGKPYKLRGLNRHQDQAPAGVAIDDEAHRRDIALMKELGCNFIRISHYPQDDAIVDMCDELGLLAWEEIPIINIVPDTPGYDDICERNLREMIRQHYNHPSIIAWGYMNEILLTAPSVDKPEWPACRERTVNLAQRLEAVLKEEDSSRVSVMAYNMTDLYNEIGLDLIDVVGWNLYQGWYVDKLEDFNAWCEDKHQRYPEKPMIISEWGAGSDRRLHSNHGRAFDFSIEYHQTYVEHYLPFIENTEWISGCAYWNFVDFNVAARQESMPRVNNKGLAYNDRTWKDVAYYFKSMWRKDVPVLRIASRDWSVRTGKTGQPQSIKLYSNMPEVELFLNGQSLGRQKTVNCHTVFHAVFPEGSSVLVAQGVSKGKVVQDAMTIQFNPLPDIAKGDELAINVGSNCYFISDISNLTWLPDQPYTAGSWGYIGGEARSTTSEIHNTLDGPVYQTWREGDWSYRIDAPAGEYEVELLLADVTRPAVQLANLLGKNKEEKHSGETRFHLSICGKQVETDFSPADGGRYRTACKRRYIIHNEGDHILITATPVKGQPFLSGIKVRKL